jgi:hypothetical protein
METDSPGVDVRARKRYSIRLLVAFVGLICISQSSTWGEKFLLEYTGPWWMRLAVVGIPWVAFGLFLLTYRRVWRPDELETIITHRALAFAFYGMMFGLIVADQLQTARLIPAFTWTTDRLAGTMMACLLAGIVWSKRRYR